MARNWTDETTERLRQLAAYGLTASQVEREMAGDCPWITRNSIMGRAYRLDIKWSHRPSGRPEKHRAPRPPRSVPLRLEPVAVKGCLKPGTLLFEGNPPQHVLTI